MGNYGYDVQKICPFGHISYAVKLCCVNVSPNRMLSRMAAPESSYPNKINSVTGNIASHRSRCAWGDDRSRRLKRWRLEPTVTVSFVFLCTQVLKWARWSVAQDASHSKTNVPARRVVALQLLLRNAVRDGFRVNVWSLRGAEVLLQQCTNKTAD